MKKIKKIRLKSKYVILLKFFLFIFCLFLGVLIFYFKQIHDLEKLGYSKKASNNILFSFNKDYVVSIGSNKTLNRAFEDDNYCADYLDNYSKINYVSQPNLIKNINKLLKIGYSNNDINIILSHGNDESVSKFAEREKIKYLEEFFSVSYAKLDNYDRYVTYSDNTGEDEKITVLLVNLDLDKDDYTDANAVNKFSYDMLVNKHNSLDSTFVPDDLVSIPSVYASEENFQCNKVALEAFKKMYNAALNDGFQLIINSAYRSYDDQVELNDYYLKEYGQNYVNKYVAFPGYSEHQTGLAFDVGSRNSNVFASSKEYGWMQENAYKYGFIYRFTKKDEFITGFRNEPWHYRYVGCDIATYIHDNDISFEEYYAMFLDK